MEQSDFNNLLERYLRGNCTAEEQLFIERWLEDHKSEQNAWTEMSNPGKSEWIASLLVDIRSTLHINNQQDSSKVYRMQPKTWLRVAAAASIIGLILLGTFFWFNRAEQWEVAQTEVKKNGYKNDVMPGDNKAVLTLSDGSTIVLDDAQNGTLTHQGATKVVKLDGKLAYDPAGTGSTEVVYNTISTPRGGQYQIELTDGSLVWLNAASSLRFPTAFVGKDRRVEITGEAYFEVAKNKSMPFIVSVERSEIQVLGTHFNVMAYKEESNIKTTLLEGSIKFVHGNNSSLIKPGQQTQLNNSGQIKVLDDIDVDAVIAWKNGNFDFDGVDIETVMRQLSRWYNVEVEYNKKPDVLFYAEIPRNTKLSEVLHALEYTSKVKFDINGKKIIVM
jgi:transmembrane sensor